MPQAGGRRVSTEHLHRSPNTPCRQHQRHTAKPRFMSNTQPLLAHAHAGHSSTPVTASSAAGLRSERTVGQYTPRVGTGATYKMSDVQPLASNGHRLYRDSYDGGVLT